MVRPHHRDQFSGHPPLLCKNIYLKLYGECTAPASNPVITRTIGKRFLKIMVDPGKMKRWSAVVLGLTHENDDRKWQSISDDPKSFYINKMVTSFGIMIFIHWESSFSR